MLAIWLSHLIMSMRTGDVDSTTKGIFERYLSTLFGCRIEDTWTVADKWVDSLRQELDAKPLCVSDLAC